MDTTKIFELLSYTLPALITGAVAYRFFDLHIKNEEKKRRFVLQNEAKKETLPLRLQAYERMTLFLERINLNKMLIRLSPFSQDKHTYENYIIDQIEQELEHNLTQQIYMSDECWTIIVTAKNTTIQLIRKASMNNRADSAEKLREIIFTELLENHSPSHGALAYIKAEVSKIC